MVLGHNDFGGFSFAFLGSPVKLKVVKLGENWWVGMWQRRTVGAICILLLRCTACALGDRKKLP